MGHREQAQFDRAGWKLGILIPSWIVQIALMLGLMGIFAYRLADTLEHWAEDEHTFSVPIVILVWECTNVGLNLLALILTFVEIGKYAAETLTPFSMLFTQVLKLTCGCGNFALDIVVHILFPQGHWSIVGLAIGVGLVIFNLLPLIYTIIVQRRVSQFDEYTHPANIKHYGFSDDTTYPSQTRDRFSVASDMETGYMVNISSDAQKSQQKTYQRNSTASSTFSLSTLKHSLSVSRSRGDGTARHRNGSDADIVDADPIKLDSLGAQRKSYIHERDTQFDDFLRHHSSGPSLSPTGIKNQVNRAMAGEFGWSPSDGNDSPTTNTITPTQNNASSDSALALSMGVVKSGRPRGDTSRSVSYEAQLVSVPERAEEEDPPGQKEQEVGDEDVRKGLLQHEEDRPEGQRGPSPGGGTKRRRGSSDPDGHL